MARHVVPEVRVRADASEHADPARVRPGVDSRRARGPSTRSRGTTRCCGSVSSASRRLMPKKAASNWSMPSMTAPALTKFGSEGSAPPAASSASVNGRIDSTPSRRLAQNRSTSFAPGNRPAMPTIAMPLLSRGSLKIKRRGHDVPDDYRDTRKKVTLMAGSRCACTGKSPSGAPILRQVCEQEQSKQRLVRGSVRASGRGLAGAHSV